MIVLWIILGVIAALILILVILLHFSIKVHVEVDKKHFRVEARYLGIKIFNQDSSDESKEQNEEKDDQPPPIELVEVPVVDMTDGGSVDKKEQEESSDKPQEAPELQDSASQDEQESSTEEEEKDDKPSLLDQYIEYKKYIPAGKKAFRKLLKLIRFYHLKFSLTLGNDDPYKAGLNFGRLNAVIYSLLGLICCIFSVKIDSTEIKCDFEKKTTDFYFSTSIYVRPSAVVALALYIGVYYLKIRKSMKKLQNMTKETSNNE